MLRLETETGWWLVTHPDHARLAGAFAERWGNERFLPPEPRANVLKGIARHDDGWATRDAAPQITSQGKPSAFSVELVGKYSAFEEIDLADPELVRVVDLKEGDLVDLEGAPGVYLEDHPEAEFEMFTVLGVEIESADCVRLDCEGGSWGFDINLSLPAIRAVPGVQLRPAGDEEPRHRSDAHVARPDQ